MCLDAIQPSYRQAFSQPPGVTVTVQNTSAIDSKVAMCVVRVFSLLATLAFGVTFVATENFFALLGAVGFALLSIKVFGLDELLCMCSDDAYYPSTPTVYNTARPIIYPQPTPVYTTPVFSQPMFTSPLGGYVPPSSTDTAPIGRQDQAQEQSAYVPFGQRGIAPVYATWGDPTDRASIGRRDDDSSSTTTTYTPPDSGDRAGIGRRGN